MSPRSRSRSRLDPLHRPLPRRIRRRSEPDDASFHPQTKYPELDVKSHKEEIDALTISIFSVRPRLSSLSRQFSFD